MGLWEVTKRMLQGKPAFEVPSESSPTPDPADPNARYQKDLAPEEPGKRSIESSRRYDSDGNKTTPKVEMIRCRCQKDDHTMQVWATIRNQSPVNVHVDKVSLCGSETVVNYPLAPAGQRDFLVYSGQKPTSTGECYANVYYKDIGTGEYFAMQHMVDFRDDQDGTFSPQAFSPMFAQGVQHGMLF